MIITIIITIIDNDDDDDWADNGPIFERMPTFMQSHCLLDLHSLDDDDNDHCNELRERIYENSFHFRFSFV